MLVCTDFVSQSFLACLFFIWQFSYPNLKFWWNCVDNFGIKRDFAEKSRESSKQAGQHWKFQSSYIFHENITGTIHFIKSYFTKSINITFFFLLEVCLHFITYRSVSRCGSYHPAEVVDKLSKQSIFMCYQMLCCVWAFYINTILLAHNIFVSNWKYHELIKFFYISV